MKYITAVFKPSRLDAVLDAVTAAGASGVTVTEVSGYGRQQGKTEDLRARPGRRAAHPHRRKERSCLDLVSCQTFRPLLFPKGAAGASLAPMPIRAGALAAHAPTPKQPEL